MNTLQKAIRPSSRRILAARIPTLATAPARWQSSSSSSAPFDPVVKGELGVGELEGAKFKVEPLRRHGEDAETMRARLTCAFFSLFLFPFSQETSLQNIKKLGSTDRNLG